MKAIRLLLVGAVLGAVGCGDVRDEGKACVGPADCRAGTECVAIAGAGRRCARVCDPGAALFCDGGVVCLLVAGSSDGVCALGGSAPIGEACRYSSECPAAGLCVVEADAGVCRTACDPAGSACAPCIALPSRGGYCGTPPSPPDGGMPDA